MRVLTPLSFHHHHTPSPLCLATALSLPFIRLREQQLQSPPSGQTSCAAKAEFCTPFEWRRAPSHPIPYPTSTAHNMASYLTGFHLSYLRDCSLFEDVCAWHVRHSQFLIFSSLKTLFGTVVISFRCVCTRETCSSYNVSFFFFFCLFVLFSSKRFHLFR